MPLRLSRQEQETIQIGDDITIKVESIRRGLVVILVDAPRDMKVLRGELVEKDADCK